MSDELPNNGGGDTPLTREELTSLVHFLAGRWPKLLVASDEDGEIVAVYEDNQRRPVGRPPSAASQMKGFAKARAPAMFLEADAEMKRNGHRSLEARAKVVGVSPVAYKGRLKRARAKVGGQEKT